MNLAALNKNALRKSHYAIKSKTERIGYRKQYDYQIYPKSLKKLLAHTGSEQLKIIPIGDIETTGDYWVIPFEKLRDLLVPENLTHGLDKNDMPRRKRWRFQIQNQLFVLYPGERRRLGEINVSQYYGALLPA